jgi:hypothetical protein
MKFEPGQKIKCIDDVFAYGDKIYLNKPKAGEIYTVRTVSGMERNDGHDWYVTLDEVHNPPRLYGEPRFSARRFELVETPTKTLGECWEIADIDDLAPPIAKALQFIKLARDNGLL